MFERRKMAQLVGAADRRTRRVCFALAVAFLLSAAGAFAQDFWSPLSDDDLMREARAAFHLGLLDAQSLPTSPALSIPASLDLINQLLARPNVSGDFQRKAYRLKLQILDRRGQTTLWTQTFNALPASLPGVAASDWTTQKTLWTVVHEAELYQWGAVKSALAHLNASGLHGESKADYVLVKNRSDLRSWGATAYFDLAAAIAADADWGIDDPYFDPYYGQTDFSQLDTWQFIEPLLQLLGSNPEDQQIGLRRWFEFAAPSSLNPLGSLFPDAPAAARAALMAEFRQKAAAFAPNPTAPVPATGGYRELLANAIKIENLVYTGRAQDVLTAVGAAPAAVNGIPDALWAAHKTGWRTYGLAGTLNLGAAVDAIPDIKSAVQILPPAPFRAFVLDLLGLIQLSQADPEGNEQFAKAFLIAIPHPLIVDQMIRGLDNGTPGLNAQHVLDIMAQTPYQPATLPQTLGARCLFGVARVGLFSEAQRAAILVQAIRDGAKALDILERNQDPAQAPWRDTLKGPLVQAVGTVDGATAAQRAQSEFASKPIRRNSAFAKYLKPIGGASNSVPIILSIVSAFDGFAASVKGMDEAGMAAAALALSDGDLNQALASLPENFQTPARVRTAKAILVEADRRGISSANYTGGDWKTLRVQRCEVLLNWWATAAAAQAELATLAADSTLATDARVKAQTIVEGVGAMSTPESYRWAQDWMTLDEKDYPARTYIFDLLAPGLAAAGARTEIQQALDDPQLPALARANDRYNIAMAQVRAGDDASALANLGKIIDLSDAQLTGDDVIRYIAESHRLEILWRQAKATPDEAGRLAIWQMIVDYATARLATLRGTDELRTNLAGWGFQAALKLNDGAAQARFGAAAQVAPKTRLF